LVLILLLLLVACEGGFSSIGSSERSAMTGRGGFVEASMRRANGSITKEIELDGGADRLETQVSLSVEEGSFAIELLDADENVTLSLEATPGNPASGQGVMDVVFDSAQYRVRADEARGVTYRLDFTFASD
jgi:hypothetical protein